MSCHNGPPTPGDLAQVRKPNTESLLWLVLEYRRDRPEVIGTITGYWKGGGGSWLNDLKRLLAGGSPRRSVTTVEIPTGNVHGYNYRADPVLELVEGSWPKEEDR